MVVRSGQYELDLGVTLREQAHRADENVEAFDGVQSPKKHDAFRSPFDVWGRARELDGVRHDEHILSWNECAKMRRFFVAGRMESPCSGDVSAFDRSPIGPFFPRAVRERPRLAHASR